MLGLTEHADMRQAKLPISAGLFGIAVALSIASPVQPAERSCKNLEDCERQSFEEADKGLASLMTLALARIERSSSVRTRQDAKAAFAEAQRHWLAFRDSSCRAEAAMLFERSARLPEALDTACRLRMTKQRIAELKDRYPDEK